jgi:hypothetical protein
MKTFLIIAIVALAISTVGAGYGGKPQTLQFGIKDVSFSPKTTSVPEAGSGDFYVVDGYRDYKAPNSVLDSTTSDQIDFPQYSRFH